MKKLSLSEKFMYYGACITSLGFWWVVKIVIKKAIIELMQYPKPGKTKKKRKKRKTAKQIAKDKAWRAFSDYIRARDSLKTTGTLTHCTCITCGKTVPYKRIQAGHGIGGRNNSILFHEEIVNGQCDHCNVWKSGNYEIYANKLISRHSLAKYEEFLALRNKTVKYSTWHYNQIAKEYKEKLKVLLNEEN